MTAYIVAGVCFIILGLCIVGALYISRKPCWQCKHWVMDRSNHCMGECRLLKEKRLDRYVKLVDKGLLVNAEQYYHNTSAITNHLDGCRKFEGGY